MADEESGSRPGQDPWDPDVYMRFADERAAPFHDLCDLVEVRPAMHVADLGCGTGNLTRVLHDSIPGAVTIGVDRSPSMLDRTGPHAGVGLTFQRGDIATWEPGESLDLVFSNAALHWVDDHPRVFRRLRSMLSLTGQLAVQVPANHSQASHTVAADVAGEEPFSSLLGGWAQPNPVLEPQEYASLLWDLGFVRQHVRLVVYPHVLESPEHVAEWTRGTLLTPFEARLGDAFTDYYERYRQRLLEVLPDRRPFFFGFRRILLWGSLSG